LPTDKQTPKELKVTDKRIFTPDGEIREEFRDEIRPSTPAVPSTPEKQEAKPHAQPEQARPAETKPPGDDKRRTLGDRAPGTPFANYIQLLVMQSYMFLGMLRDPRQPQPMYDPAAARETIDIIALLKEKTAGNLTAEEEEFLDTHLGELKLAFVQRTKSL
jgi:hypothetical protein